MVLLPVSQNKYGITEVSFSVPHTRTGSIHRHNNASKFNKPPRGDHEESVVEVP